MEGDVYEFEIRNIGTGVQIDISSFSSLSWIDDARLGTVVSIPRSAMAKID